MQLSRYSFSYHPGELTLANMRMVGAPLNGSMSAGFGLRMDSSIYQASTASLAGCAVMLAKVSIYDLLLAHRGAGRL